MAATIKWAPRWWHWLLFALAFLLVVCFTILLALRTSGRNDYQRVIAELQATGKVATIEEFIAHAPPVDVSLQEAWHRWTQLGIEYHLYSGSPKVRDDFWLRYLYGEAPLPPAVLLSIEDHRAAMQPARDLLQDTRLLISTFGHLAQDLPPGRRAYPHAAAVRMPNLLSARSLANWLHHAACTEIDPRPALDDLDRFHRAMSRPATLIDAMIWLAITSIRNEAYLDLQMLGRLPQAHRDAWMAEDNRFLFRLADAFDGERTCFVDAWARMGDEMTFFTAFTVGRVTALDLTFGVTPSPLEQWLSFQWLYSGPWNWATIHHDSAISAEVEAQISARLRRETLDKLPDPAITTDRYRGYGSMAVGNIIESALTTLEADAKHRIFRLAVLILTAENQSLPADEAELVQRLGTSEWLTPTGDHLHLAYERLADNRFRLVVSPSSPVPNFDDPKRLPMRSKAFGTPANKHLRVNDRAHLEIQLPQPRTVP